MDTDDRLKEESMERDAQLSMRAEQEFEAMYDRAERNMDRGDW